LVLVGAPSVVLPLTKLSPPLIIWPPVAISPVPLPVIVDFVI
jgi:hypothetical protein